MNTEEKYARMILMEERTDGTANPPFADMTTPYTVATVPKIKYLWRIFSENDKWLCRKRGGRIVVLTPTDDSELWCESD